MIQLFNERFRNPYGAHYLPMRVVSSKIFRALAILCYLQSSVHLSNAQAPGGISTNLDLWLKADAGVTGSPGVTAWADQSSSANNATGVNTPTLTSDAMNFNPGITFDGSATEYFWLDATALPTGSTARTYFVVSIAGTSGVNQATLSHGKQWEQVKRVSLYHSTDEIGARFNKNGNVISNAIIKQIGMYSYGSGENVDPGFVIHQNGQMLTSSYTQYGSSPPDPTTTPLNTTTEGAHVAASPDGTTQHYTGSIMEIIVYDRDLTETAGDAEQVQSYLALKYGITLNNSMGDYLASNGTTLWDPTANGGTYHNDVTGIGRDDGSSLDQRKSLSINDDGMVIMDKGSSFSADRDFLLWGNDNGTIAMTSTGVPALYDSILQRVWVAAVNGTPGAVTVRMIYANNGFPTYYGLLVDNNTDFSTGATTYKGSSISGDTITFENVSFADGDFFTLSEGLRTPGGVGTNLALWLKADAGVTGSSPITDWADQSGNQVAITEDGNPTLTSNGRNYNDIINFDGNTDAFESAYTLDPSTNDYSIFAVWQSDASTGNNQVVVSQEKGGGDGRTHLALHDGNTTLYSHAGGTNHEGATARTYGTWNLSGSVYDLSATDLKLYNEGFLDYNDAALTQDAADGNWVVGRDHDTNDEFEGNIAEVIMYDFALSASDQQKVESYLAIKWGMTLTNNNDGDGTPREAPNENGINEGNYVSSSGSVIWNATTYSSYHNDIAGIGRDDVAGLDQQQSISSNSDAMVIMNKGGSFDNDKDFIVWGNDGGGTSMAATDVAPDHDNRLERVWRAFITGDPGAVTVRFVFTGNNGTALRYSLHVDDDGTFNDAGNSYPATSLDGDTITFENIPLSDGDYFTLGETASRAPGGTTDGLVLWLRSDIGTSTTTDGSSLTSWEDQSPASSDVSQGTGDNQPTYRFNGTEHISSYPVIDFDGTDDFISTTATDVMGNATDSTYTKFIVIQTHGSVDPGGQSLIGGSAVSAHDFRLNGALRASFQHAGEQVRINNTVLDLNESYILVARYSPDSLSDPTVNVTRVNGHSATGKGPVPGGILFDDTGTIDIGGFRNGNADPQVPFNGYIAEVIIYDTELSTWDIRRVESYLAAKYGLTMNDSGTGANGDFIQSAGSKIWDAQDNVDYHNDLLVIGRDDRTALMQKQNQSVDDSLTVYIDALASDNMSNAGTITNDLSYLFIGHNGERLMAHDPQEAPYHSIISRFNREWLVKNVNFTEDWSLAIEWEEEGPFDIDDIRLLVDDDGDFTDATIYKAGDHGLTFSEGSIIIGGISTAIIPAGSTRYITIASASLGTTLPVEWIGFDARVNRDNATVELDWATATEVNNDYFTVEKSIDQSTWVEVLVIKGAGDSKESNEYYATDNKPFPGLSYYRVKQTDFDGALSYSRIVAVTVGAFERELSLYPNPTQEVVILQGSPEEIQSLQVVNVLGQDVSGKVKVKPVGITEKQLDISQLPKGLYTILTSSRSLKLIKN